ncbi:MAG: transglycosylase SLT domain-containing protein [Acidobacteriota bacterium]|nr:transglycosylase SLT domain-containing protein [Acidobacteriota bacterium]
MIPSTVGAAILLLTLLAGCAPTSQVELTPQAAPASEPVVERAVEPVVELPDPSPIYLRLDQGRTAYRVGIGYLAEGDEISGEQSLFEGTRLLQSAASDCAAMEGCDLLRFIATFDDLLAEQTQAIKQQSYHIDTLEEAAAQEEMLEEPGTESPFLVAIPQLESSVSLLKGTDLRDLIELNTPVRAALDDWLTWMRPLLMDSYFNYRFLQEEMAPVYEAAGLPEALLFAMIATETGGKVHSYSRAGAAGPLQFTRYTGLKYGLKSDGKFDTRLDPKLATRANVAYLNDRFDELDDDLEKALAAYNGGETRMLRLHRRHAGASLWDSRVYYSLPRETRDYVPRILAAAWLFLHPDEYGLEFPDMDVRRVAFELPSPISMGELTICLGQVGQSDGWFRTLRNLNPRWEPSKRKEAGSSIALPAGLIPVYEERCTGNDELMARAGTLYEANYPESPEMIPYTIRRGDTLGKIASRHKCVSLRELADVNRIRAPRYVIRVGQQITIPTCS